MKRFQTASMTEGVLLARKSYDSFRLSIAKHRHPTFHSPHEVAAQRSETERGGVREDQRVTYAVAAVVAVLSGGLLMFVVNGLLHAAPFNRSWFETAFEFWGVFYAAFATPVVFGLTLAFLNRAKPPRSSRARSVGLLIAAIASGAFSFLVWQTVVVWRVDPFTLEGMWIYPLAISTTALTIFLAQRFRHRRRPEDPLRW